MRVHRSNVVCQVRGAPEDLLTQLAGVAPGGAAATGGVVAEVGPVAEVPLADGAGVGHVALQVNSLHYVGGLPGVSCYLNKQMQV